MIEMYKKIAPEDLEGDEPVWKRPFTLMYKAYIPLVHMHLDRSTEDPDVPWDRAMMVITVQDDGRVKYQVSLPMPRASECFFLVSMREAVHFRQMEAWGFKKVE